MSDIFIKEPFRAIVTVGGKHYTIQVNGKRFRFEMHGFCGPIAVKKNGDALKDQPSSFLNAASLWAQQGQKVENGLCVWYHEPKPITKLVGRMRFLVGEEPPVRGE